MAKRRATAEQLDDGPALITLDQRHQAIRPLERAYQAGEIGEEELQRRLGRVHRAVTPRDLWKASGHRAGSRKRSDWKEIKHAVMLQFAIVGFAAIAMLLVLHGDQPGAHAWPWEWGKP